MASGTFAVWPVSERLIVRRETSAVTIRTWKEGKKKAQADDWMCSGWRTHNKWISNKTLWSQDRPAAKTYTSSIKKFFLNPPCTRKHRRHQKRHPRRRKMWNTPYTSNTRNTFAFEKDPPPPPTHTLSIFSSKIPDIKCTQQTPSRQDGRWDLSSRPHDPKHAPCVCGRVDVLERRRGRDR